GRHGGGGQLAERLVDALLKVGDESLAFRQQATALDQAGGDAALDVFDENLVLGPDLAVEVEQLGDPGFVYLRAEEVVEEPLSPLGPSRQDRADREVLATGKDVDHCVRPEEVELASRNFALCVESGAVRAHRAELARERLVECELVGVG